MIQRLLTQVINLDRASDRLSQITSTLSGVGLPFDRLSAVDGAEAIQTGLTASRLGRDLYPGEVGCYLSHLAAIDAFLKTDAQFGLVLEDDAEPTAGAVNQLSAILACLTKLPIWDVVNLGRPAKPGGTPVSAAYCNPSLNLQHAHYPPVTTTALLWSRGGARAFRLCQSAPELPVDIALQSWGTKTDRILALRQPIFVAQEVESTIMVTGRKSGGDGVRGVTNRLGRIATNKLRARHNRARRRAT